MSSSVGKNLGKKIAALCFSKSKEKDMGGEVALRLFGHDPMVSRIAGRYPSMSTDLSTRNYDTILLSYNTN